MDDVREEIRDQENLEKKGRIRRKRNNKIDHEQIRQPIAFLSSSSSPIRENEDIIISRKSVPSSPVRAAPLPLSSNNLTSSSSQHHSSQSQYDDTLKSFIQKEVRMDSDIKNMLKDFI